MDSSLELETTLDKVILDGILHAVDERSDLVILHSNVVTRASDVVNGHARDAYIRFEEVRHKYFLRSGVQELEFPVSVSGVWSQYFDEFEAVGILDRYFDGWAANPFSKYWERIQELRDHGVPDRLIKDSIQQTWTDAGLVASRLGTRMHREIECALRGSLFQGSIPEMVVFQRFVQEWLEPRQWTMYRVEWSIYDERVMVAGQIDAVFKDVSGTLPMLDWKRVSHSLHPEAKRKFGRYGHGVCAHLVDNEFSHYALQQNLYCALLKRKYDIVLGSMWLVQIHPDFDTYGVVFVPAWPMLADEMLDAWNPGVAFE